MQPTGAADAAPLDLRISQSGTCSPGTVSIALIAPPAISSPAEKRRHDGSPARRYQRDQAETRAQQTYAGPSCPGEHVGRR
jgi:hypothetical protein